MPEHEANITQLNSHDHDGSDSAQLGNASILTAAAITRSKLASGTAYRILANTSAGVMSENAALTNHRIIVADSNGQLANNAALTSAHVVYADSNGELVGEATLAVSRGGTNIASYTTGDILYASASGVLSKLGPGASGTFLKSNGAGVAPSYAAANSTLTVSVDPGTSTISSQLTLQTASGGAITLTLPAATGTGALYRVKRTDTTFANALIVARAGSDVIIDSGSSVTSTSLHTIGEEIEICDTASATWHVVDRRIPSLWIAYTPTGAWSSNTTYTGFWRRVGDSMQIRAKILATGSPTTAFMTVGLPANVTIDTAKLTSSLAGVGAMTANVSIHDLTAEKYAGYAKYASTTTVGVWKDDGDGTYSEVSDSAPFTFANGDFVDLEVNGIPITGWNG